MPYLKIERVSEIIPLLERGFTHKEVGEYLNPQRKRNTIIRWCRELKKQGYKLPKPKTGRPPLIY